MAHLKQVSTPPNKTNRPIARTRRVPKYDRHRHQGQQPFQVLPNLQPAERPANAAVHRLSKEETDARFNDIVDFANIGEFIKGLAIMNGLPENKELMTTSLPTADL